MTATVIDTLRYADRLKQAGVVPRQAEEMSRALNGELTERLVTRNDLDDAVSGLKGDLKDAVAEVKGDLKDAIAEVKGDLKDAITEVKGDIDDLGHRIDSLETKFDSKFEAVDARFEAVDARFEAVHTKFDAGFDALSSQNRYVFLVLLLIAGLGLYNAAAPHFFGRNVQTEASSLASPAAQATGNPTNAASNPESGS